MKLDLMLAFWGSKPVDPIDAILEAERLGYQTAWFAETYGSDAFSPLCWAGARTTKIKLGTGIVQMSARAPACTAMTAATIDHLSNGRLILGLGISSAPVVEGWYGQPFPKPLARTREYVEIVRKILRREEPVTSDGAHYPLPYPGGTGLGKSLKLIIHPRRHEIPIYLAAEGPKNVALAAEIADGWLPLFFSPFRVHAYEQSLERRKPGFEIVPTVIVSVSDDLERALLPVKMMLSFYLGGMGARSRNFHVELLDRMGFEYATGRIQELFLAGRRAEAIAAVPDEMADELSLCGPRDRIQDRLQAWEESPVTSLAVATREPWVLRFLAESCL
jgi:F420-dependent oxidoreductase-like protein